MTAPIYNPLNKFKGEVREPAKFWDALAEADNILAERDDRAELMCRVQELEEELMDLRVLNRRLVDENARLRNERDTMVAAVSAGAR